MDATGDIADAVRRATSLPAEVFDLADRGRIAPGYAADLVMFDPDEIDSQADFASPRTPASGIALTVTQGRIVFRG